VPKAEPASKTAPHGEALTSDTPGTLDRCVCRDGKDHSIRKYLHRNPLIPFEPYFFIKAEKIHLRRHYSDPRRAPGEMRRSGDPFTARRCFTIRSRRSLGVGRGDSALDPRRKQNRLIPAHPSSGVLQVIGASVVPCGQAVLVVDAPIRRHKFARRMDYFQQMLPLRKKTARL
jgi:hypothetical protein